MTGLGAPVPKTGGDRSSPPEPAKGPAAFARILHNRLAQQLIAAAGVVLAFIMRVELAKHSIVLPTYITFYPLVLLAALLGGLWTGLVATALSAFIADYFLLAPVGQFAIRSTSDIVGMVIFCLSGILVSVVAELYRRNREKLMAFRLDEAVRNERWKAEEERKMAESIRAERQRFLDVLETLPVMISLLTPDHRVVFANSSYRNKFGEPEDRRCFEARFGRTEPCESCQSYSVLEFGQPHHWEVIYPDGSMVDTHEYPFRDLNGSPLILEMMVDITERRRAEEELEKYRGKLESLVAERTEQLQAAKSQLEADIRERESAVDALRRSQAKLEAALASMTDSVVITDAEGRFVEFNGAYAAFYRFKSKAECVNNFDEFASIFEVSLAGGEPAPREMFAIQRALRGETAINAEYTLRRKDTGESWIGSISFSPIHDQAGQIIGAVVTARDITEAKQAEKERQTAIDFLAMVNQSQGSKDLLERAATFFQERSGCEAVGIRLREGEDYPYAEVRGLPGEFVRIENTLGRRAASGGLMRDDAGKTILECLCGSVIRGRTDPSNPFYTSQGTFWSNSTTDLIASTAPGDLPATTRHRCHRAGYESVALLPLYVGEERFGLVQLNDRRKNMFSAHSIFLWERMAGHLATAISKFRAEEALHESEEQFRNLANAIPQLCWTANADGWISWYNERWYEYTGTTPDQMEGWGWQSVHDPSALPMVLERWKISIATGKPFDMVFPIRGADGVFRPFLTRVMPVKDGEGKVVRWFGTNTDISERQRAEEELKKLNRTLNARSESDQAILHATDESRFLDEVCRIITRDCGHAMVWIGVAEDDQEKTFRPVAYSGFEDGYLETLRITWDESERGLGPTGTAIRTGQPSMCRNMQTDPTFAPWRADAIKRGYASSLVIPLKDRDRTWGAITIYSREPDAFSEGEINLLMELADDLEFGVQTLRLRAAHAKAEEVLRENEEVLGLFVEHAPAALAMFDREMRYLHASRRWREDFGFGDRDLRGASHYDAFPEIPEQWKEAHRRGLAGEVLVGEDDRFERADGSVQWIRWEIRPWGHADGEVGGIVIFSEDTTRRKEAEAALLRSEKLAVQRRELQELAKRLQQAREEERTAVARDLHDQIGQILTAIKMDIAWVVRHLPEKQDPLHNRLAESIKMVNSGVQSVRRICSGLRPGILDDLGLAAAIEWQASEFATRNGIGCKVSLPPVQLQLDGDRATAIFRIFQECLTNVARHAEATSVSASLSTQDGNLMLVVEDDGKGFSESEKTGSLGVLGMKERAKACGGSLQVASAPGKGTTVTVSVPLNAAGTEREDHAYSDRR